MGEPSASDANVRFAFGLALQAANDLWQLANTIDAKQGSWSEGATSALKEWRGPHADHFTRNKAASESDADTVVGGLRATANLLASKWAQARGEQDRINFARWVEAQQRAHEEDSWFGESIFDAVGDFFHKKDYGRPPADPPVPTAGDGFAPTRSPIHPEYENRGSSATV
jgi:hypothetical protein